jgi:hypothetical protein
MHATTGVRTGVLAAMWMLRVGNQDKFIADGYTFTFKVPVKRKLSRSANNTLHNTQAQRSSKESKSFDLIVRQPNHTSHFLYPILSTPF